MIHRLHRLLRRLRMRWFGCPVCERKHEHATFCRWRTR